MSNDCWLTKGYADEGDFREDTYPAIGEVCEDADACVRNFWKNLQ